MAKLKFSRRNDDSYITPSLFDQMVRKNSYPQVLTVHRDTIIAHGEVILPGLYTYSKPLSATGAQRYTVTFPSQNIRKNNYPVHLYMQKHLM